MKKNVTDEETGRSEYCNYDKNETIAKDEQYQIDAVVNKMKKNADCRDIIYQFAMGIS